MSDEDVGFLESTLEVIGYCLCVLYVCTVCVYCLCVLFVCTVCVYCLCVLFVAVRPHWSSSHLRPCDMYTLILLMFVPKCGFNSSISPRENG